MKGYRILLLPLLVSLFACEKDPATDPVTTITTSNFDSTNYQFPLVPGNTWKYESVSEWYEVVSSTADTIHHISNNTHNWVVGDQTSLSNDSVAYPIVKTMTGNGGPNLNTAYYNNYPSGFYGVGNEGFSSFIHFRESFSTEQFSSLVNTLPLNLFYNPGLLFRTDSGIVFSPNPALRLLTYPVVTGDRWFSNEWGADAKVTREYAGYQTIVTPAGEFECVKLYLNIDSNFTEIQFIAPEGLIKAIHIFDGMATSGPVHLERTTTLTSYTQ